MNDENNFDTVLDELKSKDGELWLRVLGQTHYQYDEIPFWVLVKDASQIENAASYLQTRIRPLQGKDGADVTVSFVSYDDSDEYSYGMFKGHEFFEPDWKDRLYSEPYISRRTYGLFDAEYPDDEWAVKP